MASLVVTPGLPDLLIDRQVNFGKSGGHPRRLGPSVLAGGRRVCPGPVPQAPGAGLEFLRDTRGQLMGLETGRKV